MFRFENNLLPTAIRDYFTSASDTHNILHNTRTKDDCPADFARTKSRLGLYIRLNTLGRSHLTVCLIIFALRLHILYTLLKKSVREFCLWNHSLFIYLIPRFDDKFDDLYSLSLWFFEPLSFLYLLIEPMVIYS